MTRRILITDVDLDGEGCAVLFELAFSQNVIVLKPCEEIEIYHVGRDQKDRDKILYDIDFRYSLSKDNVYVYITDLSISKECAEKISGSGIHYLLFDHHKTSELSDGSIKWANVCVDGTECGTSMFYKYLVDNNYLEDRVLLNEFVRNVKDWDLYTFNKNGNTNAEDLNLYYKCVGADKFRITAMHSLEFNMDILSRPEVILSISESKRKTQEIVDKALSLSCEANINGYNVWITSANSCASEIGNILAKRENTDFAAVIMISNATIELRSSENGIDVSKIAKLYGGGGHPHAAGFPIIDAIPEIQNSILSIAMSKKKDS